MASSGIMWIDYTFNLAVRLLYVCAEILGITYEEINVWIFVIGWPLQTIIMGAVIIFLWLKLNRQEDHQVQKCLAPKFSAICD
jgi:hypothetical protein